MKKEQLKRGDIIECCGIIAIVVDTNYKDGNFIKVLLNNKCRALINKDWLDIWRFSNPIKDNRIVSDRTFAIRLKTFIEGTVVNDACSADEQKYLLNVTNRLLNYQIQTAVDEEEINYLKELKLL